MKANWLVLTTGLNMKKSNKNNSASTNKGLLPGGAQVAKHLACLLADTYVLYTKTQKFHWNLVDSRFYSLHLLLQSQYEELAEANDEIAERIRMIGFDAPGSLKEFLDLTSLQEGLLKLSGDEMLNKLLQDHQTIIQSLRDGIKLALKNGDEGTADLFIERLRAHEKMAWILRSHFA